MSFFPKYVILNWKRTMLTESMITLIGSYVPESGVGFTLLTVLM